MSSDCCSISTLIQLARGFDRVEFATFNTLGFTAYIELFLHSDRWHFTMFTEAFTPLRMESKKL